MRLDPGYGVSSSRQPTAIVEVTVTTARSQPRCPRWWSRPPLQMPTELRWVAWGHRHGLHIRLGMSAPAPCSCTPTSVQSTQHAQPPPRTDGWTDLEHHHRCATSVQPSMWAYRQGAPMGFLGKRYPMISSVMTLAARSWSVTVLVRTVTDRMTNGCLE